jgi:hypothetical protein
MDDPDNDRVQSPGRQRRLISINREKLLKIFRHAASIAAFVALALSVLNTYFLEVFVGDYTSLVRWFLDETADQDKLESDLLAQSQQYAQLEETVIMVLDQVVRDLAEESPADAQAADLALLRNQLTELRDKVAQLEGAILQDPSKALTFTLLSQDLATLRERHESDIDLLLQEIERSNRTNQWVLGTVAVAFVSLIASTLLQAAIQRRTNSDA